MNILNEKLIEHIKSKPPTQWTIWQLEDFAFAIRNFYLYSNIEDRDQLKIVYNKIVKFVNESRSPTMIDPGALIKMDENKNPH